MLRKKKITTTTTVHKCTHRTTTSSISHNRKKNIWVSFFIIPQFPAIKSRIKHGNMFLTEFFILKQAHSSRAGRGDGSPYIKIMQNMYYNKICCKHKKNFRWKYVTKSDMALAITLFHLCPVLLFFFFVHMRNKFFVCQPVTVVVIINPFMKESFRVQGHSNLWDIRFV